jgi:nucleotide-binding universal stress UspA family protein
MTKKILCATDGTEHAKRAIVQAAELSSAAGAPLTLCIVNVASGGARAPLIYMHEDKEIERILLDAAAEARNAGAKSVDEVALRGREPAQAIATYASENGYDHIVTGTGDKHGIKRLVLGSVAAAVASHAHCTVTVAR